MSYITLIAISNNLFKKLLFENDYDIFIDFIIHTSSNMIFVLSVLNLFIRKTKNSSRVLKKNID